VVAEPPFFIYDPTGGAGGFAPSITKKAPKGLK